MENKNKDVVLFGEVNYRNQRSRFGIKQGDRDRHMYVIGKTGMGKTELLKNMAIQDMQAGRGVAFLDPHGDTADDLPNFVPKERIKDIIIFDPSDLDFPIAFNVMEQVDDRFRHLVASGLLSVFKKVFGVEVFSARMEYILNNTILALLEFPGATILGINRMLADKPYREAVVEKISDPLVKAFWTQEFAKYTDRLAAEATSSVQNKVGQFTASSLIRNILGQVKSTLNIRQVMDEKKILIMNLAQGKIGEDVSRLLGAMMITKIQLAAMSRADISEKDRVPFYLYVDEFQNFATDSFANILSQARKFALNLIIAHQYVAQMEETVQDAVFGNVGTIVALRVGAPDAEVLEKEFAPVFTANDLVNLAKWTMYLKLMIDGVAPPPFSANTLPPLPWPEISYKEEIIQFSRREYAHPRTEVERQIGEWSAAMFGLGPSVYRRPNQMPSEQPISPTVPRRFEYQGQPNAVRPLPDTLPHLRPITPKVGTGIERLPQRSGGALPQRKATPMPPRSLTEAFKTGPIDFRGRPISRKEEDKKHLFGPTKQKPVVNTGDLKQTLEGILSKHDKDKASS
ncbi:MAG: hypothetical protein A3C71_02245 [Candidatus Yanofskybacteria bacterium RIFCSPHIGHO2_02_FULL_43_15c]|uniref:Type IV secretion system coupling protein TraD DNA-binding domain-containing protein n=1 Tax=Candidatus Yanofskybacteria bacterium RIFCSPHIGHO2_02_FULL_43_15c TaxID=1802679 RepID=A0A1F8FN91_9BACT|nr:MAG: hypothetical protein A3C71_02245 [Candidatus Yanofskybacteria bacterium RIFCSPHIGHO2_02_FULL_43_15c]